MTFLLVSHQCGQKVKYIWQLCFVGNTWISSTDLSFTKLVYLSFSFRLYVEFLHENLFHSNFKKFFVSDKIDFSSVRQRIQLTFLSAKSLNGKKI